MTLNLLLIYTCSAIEACILSNAFTNSCHFIRVWVSFHREKKATQSCLAPDACSRKNGNRVLQPYLVRSSVQRYHSNHSNVCTSWLQHCLRILLVAIRCLDPFYYSSSLLFYSSSFFPFVFYHFYYSHCACNTVDAQISTVYTPWFKLLSRGVNRSWPK